MVRLSKRVEYALMALKCIANSKHEIVTAKEISDRYQIPYELLAKILQKLKKEKILVSIQGIRGGYKLGKKPQEIPLYNVMSAVDGDLAITECLQTKNLAECCMDTICTIKNPIIQMQLEIENIFKNKMISDFV